MTKTDLIERYNQLGLPYIIYNGNNISLLRNNIRHTIKVQLLAQFNGICPVCGGIGILSEEYLYKNYVDKKGESFHIDHIIPKCRGGSDDRSNLRVICPSCNRHKGGSYAQRR